MLNRDELSKAIDLQRRSYNLLLWLRGAISKGVIRLDRAHDYMSETEAATEWIDRHYLNLPPDCRPEKDQLASFARFFATYLTTSFDVVKQPGQQLTSSCGCYCSHCAYLAAASHLKTKKLLPRDKQRARKMKIAALQQLSMEYHAELERQQLEKLINSETSAADVALLTYGQQLIERAHGRSAGPAVLALWREIAWDKTAPRKGFQLDAEAILRAEQSLASAIGELMSA
jgi:hypothetical protein